MLAERFLQLVAGLAVIALALLLAALVTDWPGLATAALATVGGAYASVLALDTERLDTGAPLVAAGLLLAGELAYDALDPPVVRGRLLARVVSLAGMAALGLLVAAFVLTVAATEAPSGLVLEVMGALAAVAAVGLVALLAREAAARRS